MQRIIFILLLLPCLCLAQVATMSSGIAPDPIITDGLFAFWKLDETSGTRYDCVNDYDFTYITGTIDKVTGKVGSAGDFEYSDTNDYMFVLNPTSQAFDFSSSFTLACWVNVESDPGNYFCTILGKYNIDGGKRQFGLFVDYTTLSFDFRVSTDGSSGNTYAARTASSFISTGTWYCLVGWYDADVDSVYLSINGAAPAATACPSAPAVKVNDLNMAINVSNIGYRFDGIIDAAGVWKGRCPKRSDSFKLVSDIYNSGNGWEPGA